MNDQRLRSPLLHTLLVLSLLCSPLAVALHAHEHLAHRHAEVPANARAGTHVEAHAEAHAEVHDRHAMHRSGEPYRPLPTDASRTSSDVHGGIAPETLDHGSCTPCVLLGTGAAAVGPSDVPRVPEVGEVGPLAIEARGFVPDRRPLERPPVRGPPLLS